MYRAKRLAVIAAMTMFSLACVPSAAARPAHRGNGEHCRTLMPINPVHSALLHNGKVLIVSVVGQTWLGTRNSRQEF